MDSSTSVQRLEEIIQNYLFSSRYYNLNLFLEGCKPNATIRTPSSCLVSVPGYCYQHNEALLKELVKQGWVESRIARLLALTVKEFKGSANDGFLSTLVISHSTMVVDDAYLVDVGFSDNALRGPLPFAWKEGEIEYMGDKYLFEIQPQFQHETVTYCEWWSL